MYHLAQVNIAELIAPEGDPRVQSFFDNIDRINHIADDSDGFIWRYDGDFMPSPTTVFNLSVWSSIEQLREFVFRSDHVEIMRRKQEWMKPAESANLALWWIPAGSKIKPQQAIEKLQLLDQQGPSEQAFTWAHKFAAPNT